MRINLIKNTFFNEPETKKALCDFIYKAKQLSMGEYCADFERKFSIWQGRKYSILFNSGASANLALLQSLKNMGLLKQGDRIGFSALTWATNVMPIIQMGLDPVPIDISYSTLNITGLKFIQFIENTKDIKCIFTTNAIGLSCEYDIINYECRKRGIILLEDNCESIGSKYFDVKTGNNGFGATFSFFTGHQYSTIEGGMVCTDDYELSNMLKMVRANGWDRQLTFGKQEKLRKENSIDKFFAKYTFYELAYNLRPTEITGFLGCHNLKHLDEIINKRYNNLLYFNDVIEDNKDFIPVIIIGDIISSFAIPVICRTKKLREYYVNLFTKHGVEVRPLISGNICNQPFWNKHVGKKYKLPETQFLHDCGFYIPNYPELSDVEKKLMSSLLRSK